MEYDAKFFKEKSKKYNDSLELATDEIEHSMNAILKNHGLAGNNLAALQMLTAKALIKENDFLGGDMMGHICQNFMAKLDLLLDNYFRAEKEVINEDDRNPEMN